MLPIKSATDWNTIANALHVAAEVYDKDAKVFPPSHALRKQLEEQAFHARRLADIADENAAS